MKNEQFPLYKIRDFGEKINATIEYIRQNFLPLIKIVLLIVVPVVLLISIFMSNLFTSFSTLMKSPQQTPTAGTLGTLGLNYFLMIILSMVVVSSVVTAIYCYMKINSNAENPPAPMEVYANAIRKVPMLILLMILISVVSMFGFVFFFFPGVYLMVTLSLAIPIYLFEEKGIGAAFSKSFSLIKGKWWSTFGLLVVTGLIATVVSYIFAIPMYAITFGNLFSNSSGVANDPEAVMNVFNNWYYTASLGIMMVGSYTTYLIPVIALGFQYFNLSERVDGRGIRDQIKDFEQVV